MSYSRRKLITTGLTATAGVSGAAVAVQLARRYGLIPPDCDGFYGSGNTLTYASQRLLTSHSLAREFPASQISKPPFAKLRPFDHTVYDRLRAGGFVDWRINVEGMVARPASVSLAEIRSFPQRTQITHVVCEEGWTLIAQWTGTPLSHLLNAVGTLPQARYVVYYSLQPRWWHSIDMADALHPQTLLVYGMNSGELSMGHGGPLRLVVPRQLGYKSVKFINRMIVTDSLEHFRKPGDYAWYGGI